MIAPEQPRSRTASRSAIVLMPPDAMTSAGVAATTLWRSARFGPWRRPSRSIAVTTNVVMPALVSRAGDPALPDRPAVPHVEGDGDRARPVLSDEASDDVRVAQGDRPDHGSCCAGRQHAGDGLPIPQPAGDLDPRRRMGRVVPRRGLDRRGDRVLLAALPCPSPVEVDDVDPGRPIRPEPLGDATRVVRVDLLPIERPLAKADDPASAQVDRWQELEATRLGLADA